MERTAAASTNPPGNQTIGEYANYRDLLKQDDLNAVCISSPNAWHVEQILASLENGLHVLCEKPLSMVPAEVSRIVDAAAASGKEVMIAYQSRYRRDSRILRRAILSGKWGKVTSVSIFTCEDWITPNVGTWRHDPARCPGGMFVDANGHQLDLLFWLTGLKPDWVRATTENRGTPVPMVTWGEARLSAADCTAYAPVPFVFMFAGHARHWGEEIRIQTEGADFLIHDTKLTWSDGNHAPTPFPESEVHPDDADDDTPDTAFVSALRGGPANASRPETVWPVLRFTLAGLASAATGEPARCGE
jgi:predicted dehydrogenase